MCGAEHLDARIVLRGRGSWQGRGDLGRDLDITRQRRREIGCQGQAAPRGQQVERQRYALLRDLFTARIDQAQL